MKKILISLFILAAFTPFVAWAQEYTLLEPLPCIEGTSASGQKCSGGVTQTISFNDYIGYVFKFSIALAVFLAIIMVIWGGIQYMTSEVPFLKIEGKNKIEGAVTGLVMVLASYLILATIDPRLVEIQTSVPVIEIKRASLTEFQSQLASDIAKLSVDSKITIQQENQKLDGYKKEEEDLLTRYKNGELGEDDFSIELAKLRAKVLESESKITVVSARDVSAQKTEALINTVLENQSNYEKVYEDAGLSSGYFGVELNVESAKKVGEEIKAIEDAYNKKITELQKVGSGQQNIQTIQKLEFQKSFFVKQIKDEVEFQELMIGFSAPEIDNPEALKKVMNTYDVEYQALLRENASGNQNTDRIKNDPEISAIYKNILNKRTLALNTRIREIEAR